MNLTTNSSCPITPCKHLAICLSGSCSCPYGTYGRFCESVYVTSENVASFEAWRWTYFGLFTLLMLLFLAAVVEFWVRKVQRFPRVSQEQGGLFFGALACVFALLYLGIDPYRIYASQTDTVTVALRIGVGLVANLTLSSTANGWNMLMLIWLRIRSPFMTKGYQVGLVVLSSLVVCTFLVGIVCAVLLPWIGTIVLFSLFVVC